MMRGLYLHFPLGGFHFHRTYVIFENFPKIYLVLSSPGPKWNCDMWDRSESQKQRLREYHHHIMGNWWWRNKGITFFLSLLLLFKYLGFSVFLGGNPTTHDSNKLHPPTTILIPNKTMPLLFTPQPSFQFHFTNGSSCTILSFLWCLRFQTCHINGIYCCALSSHVFYSLTCPFSYSAFEFWVNWSL